MSIKGKSELGAFYYAHTVNEVLRNNILVPEEKWKRIQTLIGNFPRCCLDEAHYCLSCKNYWEERKAITDECM